MLNKNKKLIFYLEKEVTYERCFNYQPCKQNNGCTVFDKSKQLLELKAMCSKDADCVAVSCEDPEDDGECNRSMLSDSCDESTRDPQPDWIIHLLSKGVHYSKSNIIVRFYIKN